MAHSNVAAASGWLEIVPDPTADDAEDVLRFSPMALSLTRSHGIASVQRASRSTVASRASDAPMEQLRVPPS